MSTLKVNKLRDTAGSADAIVLDPNGGAVLAGVTTISTARITTGITTSIQVGGGVTISESGIEASGIGITCANLNGGQFGRRNLIINGAMQVAQRGNTDSVTSGYGGADRFKFDRSGAAVVTLRQQGVGNSPTDQGFGFCQQIDVTTQDDSLAAGDYALLSYRFEGQDLQQLKKGTANAQQVTLSFYIKSPKTGTHIVELVDQSNSGRHVNKAYTVSVADAWEKKTVTFPMETSNTITNDNARRMDLNWWLAAGSTYTSGTLQTDWGADTNANRAVGQVNCMDSTDNNVYITGVQLELGSQATAFEHQSFPEDLALCQRYYWALGTTIYGCEYGGSLGFMHYSLPVKMRATGTLTYSAIRTTSNFYDYSSDQILQVQIGALNPYISNPVLNAEI